MKRLLVSLAVCFVCSAVPVSGQAALEWNPEGLKMQRAELEDLVKLYDAAVASPAYSGRTRDRARREAEAIRDRLANGDFRLGDRIFLDVEGEEIPDTLIVENGPQITLPRMGAIPLAGVLRSELESHLNTELARYVHNPRIRADALIRLSFQGSLGSVGFYTVPADMLLTEALMHAGGPNANADYEHMRIERAGTILWEGEELQEILEEGRTLDQLNLRAGDQIVLPAQAAGGSKVWRFARWAVPAAVSLVFGVRILRP
jgi:protein involved in polysaccharide export with SLBB domain